MADEVAEALSEPQESVAHRDDVHNDVAAAIASLKGEEDAGSDTASDRDSPSGDSSVAQDVVSEARPRDSSGKFIAKSEAAPDQTQAAPEKVVAAPQSPTPESQAKPSEQPSQAVAAPVSWSAEAKALWSNLPPAIQQAAIKREQEASNGIRQYSEKVAHYEQALAPIAQEAQRRGMSPDDAIKRLIDGNAFLETQPQQAILWLAQKNGIDLAELASNPPAAPQQARPDPAYAQQSQTIQSLEQRLAQIEFGNNLTVAQQFAASKPHYAAVEDQLPQFIKELRTIDPSLSGVDLLEKAYERAIWLNPDVRAKIQAGERETAEKARQAEVQAKAQQASRAAVSVKGSSAVAVPPKRGAETEDETAYDSVRSALRQLRAG